MNPENEGGCFFQKFKTAPEKAPAPAPVPPPEQPPGAPVAPARAEDGKMAALEAAVNALKEELDALKSAAQRPGSSAQSSAPSAPPGPEAPPLNDLKRETPAAAEGGSAAGVQAGLAVRMERAENLIAELKALVSSQQAQLDKHAEAKLVAEGLNEYLRGLVAQLNTRLVEAENTMHISLSEMSARLTGSEAVYKTMFSDAENRLKESVGGELTALNSNMKKLRESVVWLADEYKIIMERKIRALEGKYSAFEAIARRMDTIDAALKRSDKLQ